MCFRRFWTNVFFGPKFFYQTKQIFNFKIYLISTFFNHDVLQETLSNLGSPPQFICLLNFPFISTHNYQTCHLASYLY